MNAKTIQAAAAAVARAQEARDKIAATLASLTEADTASTAAALDTARAEYEAAAAAHALGEIDGASRLAAAEALDKARAAFNEAKSDAGTAEAVRAGLTARLARADGELTEATAAQAKAEADWLRAEFEAADADYTDAVRAMWDAWKRAEAARSALVNRGHALPGGNPREPAMYAIGPVSADAALEARPAAPHGFAEPMTTRYDAGAARALLDAELASMRSAPTTLLGKAKAAIAKATA